MAVIKALKRADENLEIVFVGSNFGIESKLVPKIGIKYYGISTGKFRRYHRSKILNIIDPTTFFKNVSDFFKFLSGIKDSKRILELENPDVIFAKGGFVSLPVGVSARILKIPLIVHESDVVMGLANKKLASFAEKVCVSFDSKYYKDYVDDEKIKETGNPVRDDVFMGSGDKFKKNIDFSDKKKTLLILGGSQGSRFINNLILEKVEKIIDDWQIIWIAGDRDLELVKHKISSLNTSERKKIKVFGFLTSEMADVYAASDLVVSRAGSNVLFELAALGKPTILIPFDESAGGHQLENAKIFSRNGAAYLFKQDSINSSALLHQLRYLNENEDELKSMSRAMQKMSDVGASEKIAKLIIELGKKKIEQTRENKE